MDFIQFSPNRVDNREIARAFNIKGSNRAELKRLLRDMAQEGLIGSSRRALRRPDALPSVCVIEIVELDADGEPIARRSPLDAKATEPALRIRVLRARGRSAVAPGIGDRVLVHIDLLPEIDDGGCAYTARPIKTLPREPASLFGIYRAIPGRGGVIDPVNKRQLKELSVNRGDEYDAKSGDLVRFELSKTRRFELSQARVVESLGNPEAEGAQSLIAIQTHGLRDRFPDTALAEVAACAPADLAGREDLRDVPLVTIDPTGARDHDDAVWAEPDSDPGNREGWVVIVAIADVAHYVRANMSLDQEARLRGNSVYFPDRVLPMLPEKISSDLCSLIEGQDRPCLCVRMVFDQGGRKRQHRFFRALICSAATLTYEETQAAVDGRPNSPTDAKTAALLVPVLEPLFGAYAALATARDERHPLELDLPERKILLDDNGHVADVIVPPRLEAHRLIEEFMIQANVAAAEALEAKRSPLIYRVHDNPNQEKLRALSEFLATLELKLPRTGQLRPRHFNQVLARSRGKKWSAVVSDVVLRAQAQAEYNPANYGHFGLNLRRYAHFTSPIRRYADLIVHRALIGAYDLGVGAISDQEIDQLNAIAETISASERRAMAAERETVERLIAGFMADKVGARFDAVVSGTARGGLFVRLDETGAEGFVPASTIGNEFYVHDEGRHALVGERSGLQYALGDRVEVRLIESIPSAGALRFEMLSEARKGQGMGKGKKAGLRKQRRRGRMRRR